MNGSEGRAIGGGPVVAWLVALAVIDFSTVSVSANPETHQRRSSLPPCLIALDAISSPVPAFDAMPARSTWNRPPVGVDLKSDPGAAQFRTVLTDGAKYGPNFAGDYTIVGWGCGTSCLDWAVIDVTTGKVHFEPSIRVVSTVHVDDDKEISGVNSDFNALRFRQDSNLLVVLGAPNEDESRDGVAFYRWTGGAFELLKFFPRDEACRSGG